MCEGGRIPIRGKRKTHSPLPNVEVEGLEFSFFFLRFFSLSSFKGGGWGGFCFFFRFSFWLFLSEQLSEATARFGVLHVLGMCAKCPSEIVCEPVRQTLLAGGSNLCHGFGLFRAVAILLLQLRTIVFRGASFFFRGVVDVQECQSQSRPSLSHAALNRYRSGRNIFGSLGPASPTSFSDFREAGSTLRSNVVGFG